MFSLGTEQNTGNTARKPGRWAAVGPIVLAVVFLVALVLAANNNTVLGWFLAIVALGWLIIATLSYVVLVKAMKFGRTQVQKMQSAFTQEQAAANTSTHVVSEETGDGVRDLKLDHSFKIVQVQTKVVRQKLAELAKDPADSAAREDLERALETVDITAQNARDMIGLSGEQSRSASGTTTAAGSASASAGASGTATAAPNERNGEGPEEPLTGVVIQD